MSKKALLTKIRDCISDRTSVLTKAELGVIDRELELFDSLVSHSLEINELAVLIAGVCKPIYEDTEKGIRRSHEVSGLGCLSSCLSSSPIVNAFWEFGLLGPSGTDRNLIVGRGHIAPAFYALRYSKGCFPLSFLLSTHRAVPAVVHKDWGFKNTMRHSLGEGIAMSIGRSLLESPKGNAAHNYCFSGDGELNEGICFEAIRIAYENDIKKYTLIVDDNESGIEKLKKPLNIKYLEAFFDKVHIIDNPEKRLLRELENCTRRGLREAIVCKTKKGTHSYKMPGLPSNTSTCSAISDILVRLSRKYCSHVITPDMAGRFGLVEKLGYINTGLSEQASVAMTIGLPTDEVKLILTDDKFLLNSIDCIQSAMSSVNNLQIIAARRNDVWGGPVSTPNILTSIGNVKVYELCDPEILEKILHERVKSRKNTIYLFSDQSRKSIESLKTGYTQIGRDFLFMEQDHKTVLLISTESFALKVKDICDHYKVSHLRILCRRPVIIEQVSEIIKKFKTIIVYENNSSIAGLGEYLKSILIRDIQIISVDSYEIPSVRKIQERRSISSLEQLIDLTERHIGV